MSREIKIRLWSPKDNEYHTLGALQAQYISWGDVRAIAGTDETETGTYFPYDGAVLEQWTGLKDKTGRDIYEGDILERAEEFGDCVPDDIDLSDPRISQYPTDARCGLIFRGKKISEVKYWDGSFRLFGKPMGRQDSWLKVLGNIHHNPELLEASQS
jgi:uncharacterized phage protein (TIGR01671 family)